MRRFHLIEFEDFLWFPKSVRDGITDYLRFFISTFNIYGPIVIYIKELLEQSGTNQIIEVASGSGGAIEKILRQLDKISQGKTKVLLTDYFPNLHAFNLLKKNNVGRIDFVPTPVDAADVPAELTGVRTIFSAFHHFDNHNAIAVIRDAVRKNQPIGIFDGAERKFRYILGVILSTLAFIFLVPLFTKPFRLSRLFFTYIIPLIPVFGLFDGIVSMLRIYSPEELMTMAKEIEPDKYVWKSGRGKHFPGIYVTYLIGYPNDLSFPRKRESDV